MRPGGAFCLPRVARISASMAACRVAGSSRMWRMSALMEGSSSARKQAAGRSSTSLGPFPASTCSEASLSLCTARSAWLASGTPDCCECAGVLLCDHFFVCVSMTALRMDAQALTAGPQCGGEDTSAQGRGPPAGRCCGAW